MSSFENKIVLITGGASGIGLRMGQRALELGAEALIIWDVSETNIARAKEHLQKYDDAVHTHHIDIARPEQIQDAAQKVHSDFGGVDILFNNAGIITGKHFNKQQPGEIQQTIDINLTGAMHVTNAFLPDMIEQQSGHIVNIASAAGLVANPGMAVYAASKWGLVGWSESLRIELEHHHPGLHITTVQPGYIDTGMFAGVTPPLLTPLLDPAEISEAIIGAVQKNIIVLRKPFMVKLIPFLKGILPTRLFDFVAGKLFKVYSTMDSFTGRNAE